MSETRETNYKGVFDNRIGFGERPCRARNRFHQSVHDQGCSILWPGCRGCRRGNRWAAGRSARARVPIIYTKVLYHPSGIDGGLFVKKVPALRTLVAGEPLAEIDPRIPPAPEDLVIIKNYPSCFFGTSLASTLTGLGIDTLILTGCSTSGCVRAAAIDAIQYGYRVIVPRECVGDRHDAPHDANLFDINAKYGDVIPKADVIAYFSKIGKGSGTNSSPTTDASTG